MDRAVSRSSGALAFLCSYSNWFLLCAFLAVLLAKSFALSRIAGGAHGVAWIWVLVAKDALLCFGLAALFRVIERRVGWAAWPTALMGFLILVVSVLSVTYLLVAGELLSWQSLSVGVARFDEVRGIAAESAPVMWLVGTALFVLLAVPYSCRRRWGSSGSPSLGFGVAVVAGVMGLLAPTPEQVPVARLGENVTLAAFAGYLEPRSTTQSAGLFGRFPTPLSSDAITQWAQARKPPNVLFFVLESTRWDVTSLAGGPADTPALAQLAERGLSFQNARAVVPHTTKSLWSFLCGHTRSCSGDCTKCLSRLKDNACRTSLERPGIVERSFKVRSAASKIDRAWWRISASSSSWRGKTLPASRSASSRPTTRA